MNDAILEQVRQHPGITAKEIRKALAPGFPQIRKKDVNAALYAALSNGLVNRLETGAAPKWEAAAVEATA